MPENDVQLGAANPFSIIERAAEKGVSAETMEKLVQLHHDWQSRRAAEEYAKAMQACQGEMPVVLRSRENPQTKSKYAPLEQVHEVVKPVYLKHGFSLSFGEAPPSVQGQCNIYCDVRHVGGHTERHSLEGALDTAGFKGNENKTAIQGKGSTVSYLRRYLTLMIFNITVQNEDRDGMSRLQAAGPNEIRQINELIDECRELGRPVDMGLFLTWLDIPSLEQLTMQGFSKAMRDLNRKRKGEKAKANLGKGT